MLYSYSIGADYAKRNTVCKKLMDQNVQVGTIEPVL